MKNTDYFFTENFAYILPKGSKEFVEMAKNKGLSNEEIIETLCILYDDLLTLVNIKNER